MQEQLERNRQCQQNLDAASKRLREKEDSLAQAGEVSGASAPWGLPSWRCFPEERECMLLFTTAAPRLCF